MITKFNEPIRTKKSDIDEMYHGKYVAYLDTDEMFGRGLCDVIAVGEKTDEVFDLLWAYSDEVADKMGMYCSVCSGDKYRDDGGNIYVEIRNIR